MQVYFLFVVFAFSTAAAPPPKVVHMGQSPNSQSSSRTEPDVSLSAWFNYTPHNEQYGAIALEHHRHGALEHTDTQLPPAPHQQNHPHTGLYPYGEPHQTLGYYCLQNRPQFGRQIQAQDVPRFDDHRHQGGAHHHQEPCAFDLQISQNYELLRQLCQQYPQHRISTYGRPPGFYGSMAERAHLQVDPQLQQHFQQHHGHQIGTQGPSASSYHPPVEYAPLTQSDLQLHHFFPLEVEGHNSHLFAPAFLDPDLPHEQVHVQEGDHGTMQAEHHDSGRSRKGKEKEAGEGRSKGKGKGKSKSHSESHSPSHAETPDQPVWEGLVRHHPFPKGPTVPTSDSDQRSTSVDAFSLRRLKYLQDSDFRQRKDHDLPSQSDQDTLSRKWASEKGYPLEWKPLQPTTQAEYEQKRKEALWTIESANQLLKSDQPPEVSDLCRRIVIKSQMARERSESRMANRVCSGGASSSRRAQGLLSLKELQRIEEILFGERRTKRSRSEEGREERQRVADETFKLALARLKNNEPISLEDARDELLSICGDITRRRETKPGKRQA